MEDEPRYREEERLQFERLFEVVVGVWIVGIVVYVVVEKIF